MRLLSILFCLMLTALPVTAATSMVDSLGQLPMFRDVTISPDGKRIAYLQKLDNKYVLVNRTVDGSGDPNVYGLAEGALRDYSWVSNEQLLVGMTIPYYSRGDYELYTLSRTGILDVNSNEMMSPFGASKFVFFLHGPRLVNILPDEPDHILMEALSTNRVRGTQSNLYKVSLLDGGLELLEQTDDMSTWWITNRKGEVVLRLQHDPEAEEPLWWYRAEAGEEFVRLGFENDGELFYFTGDVLGTDPDVSRIYYIDYADQDRSQVMQATLRGGMLRDRKIVTRSELYDVDSVLVNHHTGGVVGTVHTENRSSYHYIDRDFAQVQANLEATFPEATVSVSSYTRDLNQFVFGLSGPGTPDKYLLYNRKEGSVGELADAYPDLQAEQLSAVERFDYEARDGLAIHSYLTLPRGEKPESLPLVVLPHGGPNARDDLDFYWLRQFYAAQGYAVFQPNFRGSSGYGQSFMNAGLTEWGGKMQQDVDDGVLALIDQGYIDPQKVCVVGGSYGGYVALMAVMTRPEQYQCAVTFGAVTDLSEMINHSLEQKGGADFWIDSIGSRFDKEAYEALSPTYLAGRDTPPVLLFHGDKDTVVPPGQSFKLSRILKKSGNKDFRYKELDDEDHWFTLESTRKTFLAESAEFIAKAIGS